MSYSPPKSVSRLWTISVLLEPYLYFMVLHASSLGNISKVLQAVVCLYLAASYLSRPHKAILTLHPVLNPLYLYIAYSYLITLGCALISSVIPDLANYLSPSLTSIYANSDVRFFLELIINSYYFVYFVLLSPFFLKQKSDLAFFTKTALFLVGINFILGWLDFILQLFNYDLIPRHFIDGVDVGLRFHGISGEPRDAAVLLISLFCLIPIWKYLENNKFSLVPPATTLLIITSLGATSSFSSIIGLGISIAILLFYASTRLTSRNSIKLFAIILVSILLVSGSVHYNKRLARYYISLSEAQTSILSGRYEPEQTETLSSHFNNIYPIIDRSQNKSPYSFLPILFGSGIQSAGVVNSLSLTYDGETANPNSNLVRLIYEVGIFGLILYILAFLVPIKKMLDYLSPSYSEPIFIASVLMIGSSLGHRSNIVYICLGFLYALYIFTRRTNNA